MSRKPELIAFESGTSISRYFPPSGTAGLARSRVRGKRRLPWPPPRITVWTRRFGTSRMIDGILGANRPHPGGTISCRVPRGTSEAERQERRISTLVPSRLRLLAGGAVLALAGASAACTSAPPATQAPPASTAAQAAVRPASPPLLDDWRDAVLY